MKLYSVYFDEYEGRYEMKELTFNDLIVNAWNNDCIDCMKYESAKAYKDAVKEHRLMMATCVLFYENTHSCAIEFLWSIARDKMHELNNQHRRDRADEADALRCANQPWRDEQRYYADRNDNFPSSYVDIRGI